ncbi:glycosyl hydrolase family 95 catalytic domain-containing protein [Bacteroides sp.]|uniref:glycosyl hydrolase family 95 catalytic domain-containing protein n=1 Tax=Bacteroides sp. TaxID=29523 RepID=UPI0025BB5737|nr:glycoside hydrolase N-terminal domain-containing protein [Bacteroides sp.]
MKLKTILINLCLTAALSGCQSISSDSTNSSGRWVAWSSRPAPRWEDAFVTGNGSHGMMVSGTPQDERIINVHEELFIRAWDHNRETVPVTSQLMPQVRELIDQHRNAEAARLITSEADRQLNGWGCLTRTSCCPHPAFDLRIQSAAHDTTSYRRLLDLETGEARVNYQGYQGAIESAFTSRKHNVNVIRLKAGKGEKLNTRLSLEETPGRKGTFSGLNLDSAFLSVESAAEPGWLSYKADYRNDPTGYEGLARVTLKGGSMVKEGASLRIDNADEVLVVVRITPLKDGKESHMETVRKELAALPQSYNELLAAHATLHSDMFLRMQLDLGQAVGWKQTPTEQMLARASEGGATPLFLEQIHAMGRYLLISSCGKYPPPLQGIWGGSWTPPWVGGFVWDSNLNLAISAASMSNLPECAESYSAHVESLLPGWRLNTKNYLGCRGFLPAHYNDPENGYLTHFLNSYPWMCWAGGAGWNIRPIYDYAMNMGDDDMLKNRVLPLYREMADFYEDFLVMGSDSTFHIYPGISPENAPNGDYIMLTKDATMDVAVAREVFEFLLDMGTKFNLPKEETDRWSYYLDRLPRFRINDDGALAEWIDPYYTDNYSHRHLSHMYPVFPGFQISKDTDDEALREATKEALRRRFAFDATSAHGLVHLALQALRMGELEMMKQNIDRFSSRSFMYDGLVSAHFPNHNTYNLDGILSFPRLLMEMVLHSQPGKIELLPAWPKEYPDGSLKGVRAFGGHTLDIVWKNGALQQAVIHAGKDDTLQVRYKDTVKTVELHQGQVINWAE